MISLSFTISPAKGDISLVPERRNYILSFIDIADCKNITVKSGADEKKYSVISDRNILKLELADVCSDEEITITLEKYERKVNAPKSQLITEIISKTRGSNDKKAVKYTAFIKKGTAAHIPKTLKKPLEELEELVY